MALFKLLSFLTLALSTGKCRAASPVIPTVQVRNAPGMSVEDTHLAIRHGLAAASLGKRKDYTGNQTLAKSWSGATLLSIQSPELAANAMKGNITAAAGIEVTCTDCYITGLVTAKLTIDDKFNASDIVNSTLNSVRGKVTNFTETFETYLSNYTNGVKQKLDDGFDADDFVFPIFPFAFDLEVPPIPQCNIRLQFDQMEMYVDLNTVLSAEATYEINLYASTTPIGIRIGPLLQLGVVFAVDLIVAAEGHLDMSSGFHIKLEDGVALDITLFGDKVSNMIFNGGQFEFLPVTVESAGVVISAVLRIGVHCGIEIEQPPSSALETLVQKIGYPTVRAGVEVAVYAHVAEFITNVTLAPNDKECKLKVIQEYNLALGAIAGASIEVSVGHMEPMTWGPVADKTTAIYTTTLKEVCVMSAKPKPTQASITGAAAKRAGLTTKVISTVVTTSGISCIITGIANCPVSAQNTTKATFTKYHTTAVPSGVSPTFPESIHNSVQSTRPFGKSVNTIKAMSGSPTAYTAPPTSTSHHGGAGVSGDGEPGTQSKKSKNVVVGVVAGLGIPLLVAAIVAAVFLIRRRKKRASSTAVEHTIDNAEHLGAETKGDYSAVHTREIRS